MTTYFTVEKEHQADSEDLRIRRLWAAVIRRAIIDWVIYKGSPDIRKRRLFWDAHEWLFVEKGREFHTFEVLCRHLGVDPGYIRSTVKNMTKQDIRAVKNFNFNGR